MFFSCKVMFLTSMASGGRDPENFPVKTISCPSAVVHVFDEVICLLTIIWK